jgi:hypothetical protein
VYAFLWPSSYGCRRYNNAVLVSSLPPEHPPENMPETRPAERPGRYHIYKLEAAGLLIIGALILVLTLVRYGHHIAWSAR